MEKEFGKFGEIDYIHIEERLLTDEEWKELLKEGKTENHNGRTNNNKQN